MPDADPTPSIHGLHHVTVMGGDPQENLAFYTGVMGMRLVKKSVNQDAPDTYHLFYADGVGSPGTDLTFFPWPDLPPGRPGVGQIVEVPLAVPPGSLDFWQARLADADVPTSAVETRFGERTLPFEDPHGLRLALVETGDDRDATPWADSPVPPDRQVRGLHAVRMRLRRLEATEALLTGIMGFDDVGTENGWHRFGRNDGASGTLVEIRVDADGPSGRNGTGTVHHAAWRVRDADEEEALRHRIAQTGLQPTNAIDRFWFTSVYFREPGGVLFELATDGPGFTADEDLAHLGESLVLPPWLEDKRSEIEDALPPLGAPNATADG